MHPKSTKICPRCEQSFTPNFPKQTYCTRRCANTSPLTPEQRFWAQGVRVGACLFYRGIGDEYGQFAIDHSTPVSAHRYAYEVTYGPIPEGMQVLHTCPGGDNKGCVEPTHLRAGTHAENMRDMDERGSLHRGDNHHTRLHPEWLRRGDNHPARLRPERMPHGERQHLAKMTEQGVCDMRQLATAGATFKELGERFGISAAAAHAIVSRKTWKHVA